MKHYRHEAIHVPSKLFEAGITDEVLIRQQIQELIRGIPLEDLYKVINVTREKIRTPYFCVDEEKVTVSINL